MKLNITLPTMMTGAAFNPRRTPFATGEGSLFSDSAMKDPENDLETAAVQSRAATGS
jgi:hypothetical protein